MKPSSTQSTGETAHAGGEHGSARLPWEILTLLAFCAFFLFFGLGSFGLVGADEPRYAQIAREMLDRRDWVTPVLNGVPWLEKPPLYYWGAMLSYSLFGVSDWAARVPTATLATLMVVGIYAFMRRFRGGSQLDAALITVSSAAIIGFGRGASTDMPITATFTLGMLAWFTWWKSGRRMWLAAFYGAIALGMLAKGPVAPALAAAVVVAFAVLRSRQQGIAASPDAGSSGLRLTRQTLWAPGVLLFLLVAIPWYVLVQMQTGTFFRVFILEHNLARFGTNLYRHPQPFWYYLPVLLLSLLPWTVFAIMAVGKAVTSVHGRVASQNMRFRDEDGLRLFLLLWMAVPLLLFTFSQSKLPGYILPAVPAAALLTAEYLWERHRNNHSMGWAVTLLHSATAGLVMAAAFLAPGLATRNHPGMTSIMVAAGAGILILAGSALSLRAQGFRVLRLVTLVPMIVGLAFVLKWGAPLVDNTQSARPVAAELARLGAKAGGVALYDARRDLRFGLEFYRNHPMPAYEQSKIPTYDHVLVARQGSSEKLKALLPGRRLSRVGDFPPQRLEIFWVSTPDHSDHSDHTDHENKH